MVRFINHLTGMELLG